MLCKSLSFVCGLALLSIQLPVTALPGQSLQEAEQTLSTRPVFSGNRFRTDEWSGVYMLIQPFNGGELTLSMSDENGRVRAESLQIRDPRSRVDFSRDAESGLTLIQQVWGDAVMQDFINARYTDAIEQDGWTEPFRFYLGEEYGYQVHDVFPPQVRRGIYFISIMDHDYWEEARDGVRFCSNNPDHVDCLGI